MSKAIQVADYFLANADPDEGITNLKLQKLCAYAQAFSQALRRSPLFSEALHAWTHGPVIPKIYTMYKPYGKNPISTDVSREDSRAPFSPEELYILETVNGYYGRFAAWTLRDMSHADFPANFNDPSRPKIPLDKIEEAFSKNKVVKALRKELE